MGILVAGALLFRLLFMSCRRVLSGDELHYAESLFHFMKGSFLAGVSDYWSFFYPLAGLPFGFIARDAETGLRLLSVVSGAALILPGYAIARKLYGGRAAIFAGAFLALHPNLVASSTSAMTEPLYSLLLVCALYLFMRAVEGARAWRSAAMGILLGLAYLTRAEAIFFLLLFVVATLAGKGGAGLAAPLAVRVRRSISMAAFFALAVLPYFLALHAETGRWTGGSKAAVNLSSPVVWQDDLAREEYVYSLNAEGTARRIEDTGRESVLKILWKQKSSIASRYFRNLNAGFDLAPLLFSSPLLLLLVPLGIIGRGWKRNERGAEFLMLFFGLFPFAFYSIFRVELRYLVPYLPVYLIWAGAGCSVMLDWFVERISARRAAYSTLIALVFLSLVPYAIQRYVVTAKSEPVEWKEIGRWIRENGGALPRILANPGCSISYYAGSPLATFIPWTDVPGFIRFARLGRYEYVVVDEAYLRAARPTLRDLLDKAPPSELDKLKEFKHGGGRIILYRLKSSS